MLAARIVRASHGLFATKSACAVRSYAASSTAATSLSEALPSVPPQSDKPQSSPVLKTSTLQNGVRIATISSQVPTASIGIFVDAGSRCENLKNAGTSFALKSMAYSNQLETSGIRFIHDLETIGALFTSTADREHISYTAEVESGSVKAVVPLLLGALHPRLADFELRDEIKSLALSSAEIQTDARSYVYELLHQQAFRNKGLGSPLYLPESNVHSLKNKHLQQFVSQYYTPDRLIVAAAGGVDHEALSELVSSTMSRYEAKTDNAYPSITVESTPAKAQSKYVGGELRLASNIDTYAAIAFEGVSLADKDVYAAKVLEHLLGGHRARVQTTIGSQSRLGSKVDGKIQELTTFSLSYTDTGLFGVFGRAEQGNGAQLSKIILSEISAVSGSVEKDLKRAIAQAKAAVLFGNECRSALIEFVAAQQQAGRQVQTPEQFAQSLEGVTAADVERVAKRIFSSKPTIVALGDVADLPTTEEVHNAVSSSSDSSDKSKSSSKKQ